MTVDYKIGTVRENNFYDPKNPGGEEPTFVMTHDDENAPAFPGSYVSRNIGHISMRESEAVEFARITGIPYKPMPRRVKITQDLVLQVSNGIVTWLHRKAWCGLDTIPQFCGDNTGLIADEQALYARLLVLEWWLKFGLRMDAIEDVSWVLSIE